jgi:hypothetical protein
MTRSAGRPGTRASRAATASKGCARRRANIQLRIWPRLLRRWSLERITRHGLSPMVSKLRLTLAILSLGFVIEGAIEAYTYLSRSYRLPYAALIFILGPFLTLAGIRIAGRGDAVSTRCPACEVELWHRGHPVGLHPAAHPQGCVRRALQGAPACVEGGTGRGRARFGPGMRGRQHPADDALPQAGAQRGRNAPRPGRPRGFPRCLIPFGDVSVSFAVEAYT